MMGLGGNRDAAGGRGQCCGVREHFIRQVMNSTVMSSPSAKFVLVSFRTNNDLTLNPVARKSIEHCSYRTLASCGRWCASS